MLAVAALAATALVAEGQQNTGAAGTAAASTASKVYDPGDVYLSSSRVFVLVGKTGLGHEHGVVGRLKSGRLRLDMAQQSGQLVFDMQSFVADTDAARNYVGLGGSSDASTQRDVTANMLSKAVLDTARFPTATFTVVKVTSLAQRSARGLPKYQLDGDFTLHGVTRRIQVVADTEEKDGWTHLRGGFSMLQSQFGITPFSKAFGAVGVTDQLRVWGDFWIAKNRQNVPLAQATK